MPIALLTDFGTRDFYVGAMKGVILSISPEATIIDISHEIEPQNINAAAFVLRACYRDFPADTIFLCVVDPGVGSDRRGVIVESNGYVFVGPDNGLFSFVLGTHAVITAIENDRYFRKPVSSTFHGRDVFAPVAAHLSKGIPSSEFGPRIADPVLVSGTELTRIADDLFEGRVIHIDRFGNLVTNISAPQVLRPFNLEIGGVCITDKRESYAGGSANNPFAIVGSAGFVEISVNSGSAAKILNTAVGTPVVVRFI